jgi:hypothetical protein
MKTGLKLSFKTLLLFVLLVSGLNLNGQNIPIKNGIFGQNAWLININQIDNNFISLLPTIQESGVKFIRIGGIAPNFFPLYSWNGNLTINTPTQVVKLTELITEMRLKGIQPIIQVGYSPQGLCPSSPLNLPLADQATIAGNLVNYINNTWAPANSQAPVENWIIANEPDLPVGLACNPDDARGFGYNNYNNGDAALIAAYTKEFSTKMKDASKDIRVIGPELAMFGNDQFYTVNKIMNDLINDPLNNNSIMGTIPTGNGAGKYYIDVISFHYYPNNNSRQFVIDNPTMTADGFQHMIETTASGRKGIVNMIKNNNTNRNISNLKIACTEFNLEHSTGDESGTLYEGTIRGHDNRSFISGQWLTENFFNCYGSL